MQSNCHHPFGWWVSIHEFKCLLCDTRVKVSTITTLEECEENPCYDLSDMD